jgi:hypothetical protein
MGEKRNRGLCWIHLKESTHLDDLIIDGRITLKLILTEIEREGVDWINLAQDRERWRALVNTVQKTFWFNKLRGNPRQAEELSAYQKRVCSQELVSFADFKIRV